jgi:hypothetical protein
MMMMAAEVGAITDDIQPWIARFVNVDGCAQLHETLCITCAETSAERWMNQELLWVTRFVGG